MYIISLVLSSSTLARWVIFQAFLGICFFNFKKSFRSVSNQNSLDPNQDQCPVTDSPDLAPNCLQQQKLPLVGKELTLNILMGSSYCISRVSIYNFRVMYFF